MAKVEVTHTVKHGRKSYRVKSVGQFMKMVSDSAITGTARELKIAAYGIKDYIIDKLLAQLPLDNEIRVVRPSEVSTVYPEPPIQKAQEPDHSLVSNRIVLPRESPEPTVRRLPFNLHPLSPRTFLIKKKQKLDTRILIATGDYLRGIVVRRREEPGKGVFYVITVVNRKHHESNLTLQKIAKIHEYGTGEYTVRWGNSDVTTKIPARPHWRPAWEEAKTIVENMGQFAFPKNLEEALRKLV